MNEWGDHLVSSSEDQSDWLNSPDSCHNETIYLNAQLQNKHEKDMNPHLDLVLVYFQVRKFEASCINVYDWTK